MVTSRIVIWAVSPWPGSGSTVVAARQADRPQVMARSRRVLAGASADSHPARSASPAPAVLTGVREPEAVQDLPTVGVEGTVPSQAISSSALVCSDNALAASASSRSNRWSARGLDLGQLLAVRCQQVGAGAERGGQGVAGGIDSAPGAVSVGDVDQVDHQLGAHRGQRAADRQPDVALDAPSLLPARAWSRSGGCPAPRSELAARTVELDGHTAGAQSGGVDPCLACLPGTRCETPSSSSSSAR